MARDYSSIERDSMGMGERKDCAVRAVTAVSNLPYEYVHKVFAECGRKPKRGTPFHVTTKVLKKLNIWTDWMKPPVGAKTICSLKKKLPKKGRFLVRVRGHILAAVDGNIVDWTEGRRHRIKEFYQVSF